MLLLFVSFLPFPTGLVAGHIGNSDAAHVATAVLPTIGAAEYDLFARAWS